MATICPARLPELVQPSKPRIWSWWPFAWLSGNCWCWYAPVKPPAPCGAKLIQKTASGPFHRREWKNAVRITSRWRRRCCGSWCNWLPELGLLVLISGQGDVRPVYEQWDGQQSASADRWATPANWYLMVSWRWAVWRWTSWSCAGCSVRVRRRGSAPWKSASALFLAESLCQSVLNIAFNVPWSEMRHLLYSEATAITNGVNWSLVGAVILVEFTGATNHDHQQQHGNALPVWCIGADNPQDNIRTAHGLKGT